MSPEPNQPCVASLHRARNGYSPAVAGSTAAASDGETDEGGVAAGGAGRGDCLAAVLQLLRQSQARGEASHGMPCDTGFGAALCHAMPRRAVLCGADWQRRRRQRAAALDLRRDFLTTDHAERVGGGGGGAEAPHAWDGPRFAAQLLPAQGHFALGDRSRGWLLERRRRLRRRSQGQGQRQEGDLRGW